MTHPIKSTMLLLRAVLVLLTILMGLAACDSNTSSQSAAITTQPTDQSVVTGTTATFNVVASAATGYQWQSSTDSGTTFVDVNGATTDSYTTAVTTLGDSGTQYRVVVTGASNSVTSSAVTLTVTSVAAAPSITVQPAHASVTAPAMASFSVTATGTNLNYQWQQCQDANETCASWSDLSGAIAASYATGSTDVSMTGQRFRVVVSNTEGSLDSAVVSLNVDPTPVAPVITSQPVDASVVAPATASFTVAFTSVPTVLPLWQYSNNGTDWFNLGVLDNTYTTDPTSMGDDGRQFRAILENAAGSVTTNVVTLTVTAAASAPGFSTQPADVTITEGQNAQFTVVVTGTPTPTLQWQVSTDSGSNWSNITNETGATFTAVAPSQANTGRQFRCVASNSEGSVNSNGATLTVNTPSPLLNIVFARAYGINPPNDLYLIKEDGTGETLLAGATEDETFAAMAPNGRVIYHQATNNQDIYSVNSSGTDTQILANSADFESWAGITSSGRVIYRRDTTATGRDLWSVNADGSNPQVLASSVNHEDFAGITTSGKVLYQVAGDLYSINADGTGSVALAASANTEGFEGELSAGQVLVSSCNGFGMCSHYSVHENGGAATLLATDTFAGEYSMYLGGITTTGQAVFRKSSGPTWAPDYQTDLYGNGTVALAASADSEIYIGSTASGQVIYRRTTGGTQYDLYIVNADGNNTIALANSPDFNEHFNTVAPDGRIIYSRCTTSDALCDLYAVNADGTNNVPVANSTDYEDYKGVTADGHVIYERTIGTTIYLYAYNTANNVTTPLVTSGGHAVFLAITPNNKVLFRRNNGYAGNFDIYIINTDGTALTPLGVTGNSEFFNAIFP